MNKNKMLSSYTMNSNIIAVDFDGTITNYKTGTINFKAVKYLNKIYNLGYELVLWTARKEERLEKAISICKTIKLAISLPQEQGKITAFYYIDDRSVPGGKINWRKTYKYLKKHKS